MARNTRRRSGEPEPPNPVDDIADTFFGEDAEGVNLDDVGDMSAEEFTEFIDDNMSSFTESDLAALREFASSRAMQGFGAEGNLWAQASGALEVAVEEGPPQSEQVLAENQATRDDQVDDDLTADAIAEAAEVYGRTDPGVDPDLSSVEAMVPEGLDPNEQERWLTDVITQGRQQAVDQRADEIQGETGADEEEAQQIAEQTVASDDLFGASEPDWLLQMNGGSLSEQQKARYVDYWNDAYGTFISDFDTELAPILARFDGTETEAQDFAASVLADQEPLISHSIELPLVSGRRNVSFTEAEMADLRAMGYSNDMIVRLVRLAANGQESAVRPGPNGDTVDDNRWRPLAALVRYYGGGDEFGAVTQGQQDMAELEQQLGLSPGAWRRMTAKERQAFRAELEERSYESPTESSGTGLVDVVDRLESMIRQEGAREGRDVTVGILAARNNFNRGMEQYRGDELLALVYAVDPGLAQRVAATGGDPEKLDPDDNSAVFDILQQGGVIDNEGARLRPLESATGFFGFFETGGGSGGGGAGPVRRVVDPAAVKEQVQQMWSRLFLADVDDATVAAITANLQAQLDAAPEGMSFDATARIKAFLEGQDVYDELYRNKPEGMSEEEYQSQFAGGVADMIGAELDPEALKSGMRTGDYNTSVGRAASTGKVLTSSTLRGRWAQAKQTLDRFS